MDAFALLREVSDTYRRLQTLAVEAIHQVESGDENSNSVSRRRLRFLYASPNRIRFEQLGRRGMVQVVDGESVHTVFPAMPMGNGPRYHTMHLSQLPQLPHSFRSEFPSGGGDEVFLFPGIEGGVLSAEVLREEEGCFVLSVRYASSPSIPIQTQDQAVLFWVSADTRMVMRKQCRVGHPWPLEDEVSWSSDTLSVESLRLNEVMTEGTFQFTPPAEATSAQHGVRGMGGSTGFINNSADETKRIEHRGSHSWDGDTLVEQSRWKMRGLLLQFERRLTFADDGAELRVGERLTSPKGSVDGDFVLPLF